MGFLDIIFRRNKLRLRYAQPEDQMMWQAAQTSGISPSCECLAPQFDSGRFAELRFHPEMQDTKCKGWALLEAIIEEAVSNCAKEFAPGLKMQPEDWSQIVTLPASIARLKSVRKLYLYGSHLVRVPAEIGEMTNLEEFDAYTSYRLHWLPYEITRCRKLTRSRISTRALYGNYKYRPPFPQLQLQGQSSVFRLDTSSGCSVCGGTFPEAGPHQVWISIRVATDVLPLLVNACSESCVRRLPQPAKGYVDQAHRGGLNLQQPAAHYTDV